MSEADQKTVRKLHEGASSVPAGRMVTVRAGDVITAINCLHAESKRADVAETKLAAATAGESEPEEPTATEPPGS